MFNLLATLKYERNFFCDQSTLFHNFPPVTHGFENKTYHQKFAKVYSSKICTGQATKRDAIGVRRQLLDVDASINTI